MATSIWIILRIILFIIGFILFLSSFQFFLSIHPPKHSDKDIPSNYGLKYDNISFMTSDGIKIKAWLITSKKASGTVIIGHGYPFNKGNILHVAKFLYPDYNLVFYDHRYFGESSGFITTVGFKEVKDIEATIKFVKERFGKKEPIALYGFSLSASAMIMSKADVNAIIADSSYADLSRMIEHTYSIFGFLKYPFVKTTELYSIIFLNIHPKEVSPALAIKDTNVPLFVIHGEKDSQIPVENAYALKESNPNIELWIANGSDHGQAYALYKDEYTSRIKSFLEKHMK